MLPPWMKKNAPKSKDTFIQEYLYIDIFIPEQDDIKKKKVSSSDEDESKRGVVIIDVFSSVDDEE